MYDVFRHLCYHMISMKGGSKFMTYLDICYHISMKGG